MCVCVHIYMCVYICMCVCVRDEPVLLFSHLFLFLAILFYAQVNILLEVVMFCSNFSYVHS